MQHFLPSMSFSADLSELHPSLTKQIGHISSDKTTPYHALNQSLVLALPSLVWYTTRIYHILIWSEAKASLYKHSHGPLHHSLTALGVTLGLP